jgi:hypothetical protein
MMEEKQCHCAFQIDMECNIGKAKLMHVLSLLQDTQRENLVASFIGKDP